jgi:hypothetical protein
MRRSACSFSFFACVALATTACAACGPSAICTAVSGPINDPSNRTLRRNLMAFGLGQFCTQMTTREAPLKLAADAPIIGRFYPQQCTQQTLDNGDLWVQFSGFGYAYTNLSKKVTFTSAATIQYNQDFKCADDKSVYAYFAARQPIAHPDFRILQIEQPVANLMQNWIAPFADSFGQQMVSDKLAQGFTVIQDPDGSTDFDVGMLSLGQRPVHPIDVHGGDRVTWENARTEVHTGERDFIGPVNVQGNNRAIYVTMHVDGVQAVDVFVIPKMLGDPSLQAYVNQGPVGPLAAPPPFTDVVQYGAQYQRAVPVPAGMYYVVIDNTPLAGQAAPPPTLLGVGDTPAVVNYAIQIGDSP